MNRQEILNRLSALPYDRRDYWVITGAAMVLYGFKDQAPDIDLGCTAGLADRLEAEGYLYRRTEDGNRWFKIGDSLEVFENWIFDTVETLDGFPVISVRGLIEMKQDLGREKDPRDIELIRSRL